MKASMVNFAGKQWQVTRMACGYLWRITCGDDSRNINHETLLQLQHGK